MIDTHNPILSSGDNDATRAYLFESSNDPSTHAVTRDVRGSNLPHTAEHGAQAFDREFALGVREVMPINIAPEPILRGLLADGYFMWSDHSNVVRWRRHRTRPTGIPTSAAGNPRIGALERFALGLLRHDGVSETAADNH